MRYHSRQQVAKIKKIFLPVELCTGGRCSLHVMDIEVRTVNLYMKTDDTKDCSSVRPMSLTGSFSYLYHAFMFVYIVMCMQLQIAPL